MVAAGTYGDVEPWLQLTVMSMHCCCTDARAVACLQLLPYNVTAAIVITSVIGLIEYEHAIFLFKVCACTAALPPAWRYNPPCCLWAGNQ